jgi:hypothetical protein
VARAARKTAPKRTASANLGQNEAAQHELSKEQMSHMEGGS